MARARGSRALIYLIVVAGIIGVTRYQNSTLKRINLNDLQGVWDTKHNNSQRITITKRSADTGGAFYSYHLYCTPVALGFEKDRPCSPPTHIHKAQDETVTVIKGNAYVELNGTLLSLQAGTSYTLPKGVSHTFWNPGPEALEVTFKMEPGTPDESFIETLFGLSTQFGGANSVNPIQMFMLFAEHDIVLTDMPPWLYSSAKTFLVALAKAMGFKAAYPEYATRAGEPLPVDTPAPEATPAAAAAAEAEAAAEAAPEPAAAAAPKADAEVLEVEIPPWEPAEATPEAAAAAEAAEAEGAEGAAAAEPEATPEPVAAAAVEAEGAAAGEGEGEAAAGAGDGAAAAEAAVEEPLQAVDAEHMAAA